MNAFYGDASEFIQLFANKNLTALTQHLLARPQRFAQLLGFQRDQMQAGLTAAQKARYTDFLGPFINDKFRQQPSAARAFSEMTFGLTAEIAVNTARLLAFRRSAVPILLIWGRLDPYLRVSVAESMRSQAKTAALHVLEAGHWPQIDTPGEAARIMLAAS